MHFPHAPHQGLEAMSLEYRDPKGLVWHPYSVEFNSPEGTFAVEVWAISYDHALLQVEALRETATVKARIVEAV